MLDITILDSSLVPTKVLDDYSAFIWNERYNKAGDFELHTSATIEHIQALQPGFFLQIEESNKLMIIEQIEIVSKDLELKVTGRSLEALLSYRIIWRSWASTSVVIETLDGSLETMIQQLLTRNIINPSNAERKIENFIFENSGDPDIEAMTLEAQYTGENLYSVICEICEDREIGFEVYLNDQDQFVFRLYNGIDRSNDQYDRNVVIFSPSFDNLIDSTYRLSAMDYRNVTVVLGPEINGVQTVVTAATSDETGLARREAFFEARDVQQESGMTAQKYKNLLIQRGKEELTAYGLQQDLDCSINPYIAFKYGVDYFLGDIVQIETEFGVPAKCRVVEFIRSMKESGYYEYPVFEIL